MNDLGSAKDLSERNGNASPLALGNGSRVAVMGGGPAGSLFSYFLLDLAEKVDLQLQVDVYEPRDFSLVGPPGCNMCAGIVSESLIQLLAVEGIRLPPDVVQRGVDTYVLHTDVGKTRFETPHLEKRIGAVFRGAGPLGMKEFEWSSFDGYLLEQAVQKGARWIRGRINDIARGDGGVEVRMRHTEPQSYDLLAIATGVNSNALKFFEPLVADFKPPGVTKLFVREYYVGREEIDHYLGLHTIHFFLLDFPGLDFAAIVPKGNYVTVCLLGSVVSSDVFEQFLHSPEVTGCMPPGWEPDAFVCHCAPRINLTGAFHPYADRMVFLGDSGISRLYKDGIGAAYRAAKYAASTAVSHGISEADFETHYWRMCQSMERDNQVGKFLFAAVGLFKPRHFAMRGVLEMVVHEQPKGAEQRRMSGVMWDMFTGSAPYRDILLRMVHPAFWSRLLWYLGSSLVRRA